MATPDGVEHTSTAGCRGIQLHVLAPPPIGATAEGPGRWPATFIGEVLAEAQAVVESYAARMRALGVPTRAYTSFGGAAGGILAYAAAQRISLIVMATTGRSGLAHVLLGSVAERVVRHGTCPVLTVRHDGAAAPPPLLAHALPRLRSILVPLDGSRLAEAALPPILRLAQRHRAELRLLRVEHPQRRRQAAQAAAPGRLVQGAETYLAGVAHRLAAEGIRAIPVVRVGDPPVEILDEVWERRPDLVAMATHGRTGLTHLRLGSITEQVLRASPVPVLLFPARAPWASGAAPAARSATA